MEANKPVWVEVSSTDAAASREFYARLFGWQVEVNPDPQYGGYALAKRDGQTVAGIGGKQPGDPSPTTWNVYIGTKDAADTAKKVASSGGTVVMAPFEVPGQGRMTVFRDPSGAFLSAWEDKGMGGFASGGVGQFGWAELNARGLAKALPFYEKVFGWTAKVGAAAAPGVPEYTEFQVAGESVAGAMELSPGLPAEVPSYWMPYFNASDVDALHKKAVAAGAREMVAPSAMPGGRFSIVSDPQGAMFGILKLD